MFKIVTPEIPWFELYCFGKINFHENERHSIICKIRSCALHAEKVGLHFQVHIYNVELKYLHISTYS